MDKTPSRVVAPTRKMTLRLPEDLAQWIEGEATRHRRSMHAQILWCIEHAAEGPTIIELPADIPMIGKRVTNGSE